MAASLKDPGSIPGGGPKRFHDSFNFVFYVVGECISCAADTHLTTDLTSQYSIVHVVYSIVESEIVINLSSSACPSSERKVPTPNTV